MHVALAQYTRPTKRRTRTSTLRIGAALLISALLACRDGGDASSSEPSSDEERDAVEESDTADGGAARGGTPPSDAATGRRPSSTSTRTVDASGAPDAREPQRSPPEARDAEVARDAASSSAVDAQGSGGNDAGVVGGACPTAKLMPGSHNGRVQFGGHERTYLLHVPRGYAGDQPIPLIFDFHGYGQSVSSQRNASGFATLADQHGFAVVYPAGVGGSWHVNGCCGQAAQEKLDEIGAVRALLKHLQSQLCVDAKRIYASGISQGGGMAHHVGCLAADIFASVAPVSSDLRTEPCTPSRPVSELSFRGMADTLSAYEGGPVGPAGMQYQSIGAKATLERWKTIDRCTGTAKPTHELCETYTECAAGVEVTLCSLPRGGHGLYSNPERFDIAQVAWEMFKRQPMP